MLVKVFFAVVLASLFFSEIKLGIAAENFMALSPFVDELPIPPRIIIPPASKDADITITMNQFKTKFHRDFPETNAWGYNESSPGPTIEVEKGQKLTVHWKDQLPTTHLFKEPSGLGGMGSSNTDPKPDVRNVVHLHGAVVTETSPMDRHHNNDGWPDAWIVPGEEQMAKYPNKQKARTLWYHDHASAETGRNVAAGLVGFYIIHDKYERSLNLPAGEFDVPLMIQPKGFLADGSLYYSSTISKEYYGNTFVVNGKLYPFMNVEPRKYRFRILNASNARTIALKLLDLNDLVTPGPAFNQIGTDAGFLQDTVVLNDPTNADAPRLNLMPAERADVIVDFSNFAGRQLLLSNNARPDDPDASMPLPKVMLFKVASTISHPDSSSLPMHMREIKKIDPKKASVTRQIVLNQMTMADGSSMLQMNGKSWTDPISEKPILGATEIWELIDTLPDSHPFHIHLVEFQVLDRRPFDTDAYVKTGVITYTGPAVLPEPNEMGWKDTIRASSRTVTRIIVKFGPYPGYYVYHCHILEHEDMDMMRPFQIVP